MNGSSKREQSEALHITRVFPDGRETERRSAICAFMELDESGVAEIGYGNLEEYRGQGYAAETAPCLGVLSCGVPFDFRACFK